jgi:hypothetical protein
VGDILNELNLLDSYKQGFSWPAEQLSQSTSSSLTKNDVIAQSLGQRLEWSSEPTLSV